MMIHNIATQMIDWQIAKGYLKASEGRKYVYAYEILLNQLLNVSIATFLAIISHECIAVAVFLLIYVPVRKYAGGFHADSNAKCVMYSSLLIVVVILSNKLFIQYTNGFGAIMGICTLVLVLCVWYMAPVEAANKKLDGVERRRYRKRVRILCVIHAVVIVLNVWLLKMSYISMNLLLGYITLFIVLVTKYKK